MKRHRFDRAGFVTVIFAAVIFSFVSAFELRAQSPAPDPSPKAVLDVMQQVADWQLAHPLTNQPTSWIGAVGDAGIMALVGISGDAKYRDAMLALAE
ncbi:MAG: hypothetical protein ABSF34_22275, partial [Verrucomicrobiota bacterium]